VDEGFRDAPGKMKQFASWFTHGVANGSSLRKAVYESKTPEQIIAAVDVFFEKQLAPDREVPAQTIS
jgi:hypothetical protein